MLNPVHLGEDPSVQAVLHLELRRRQCSESEALPLEVVVLSGGSPNDIEDNYRYESDTPQLFRDCQMLECKSRTAHGHMSRRFLAFVASNRDKSCYFAYATMEYLTAATD